MILNRFLIVFGAILGAKGWLKWVQTSIKKVMDFWIASGRALGRQKGATAALGPSVQGRRGGVGERLKPLPREGRIVDWSVFQVITPKPPDAQRAGGIIGLRGG